MRRPATGCRCSAQAAARLPAYGFRFERGLAISARRSEQAPAVDVVESIEEVEQLVGVVALHRPRLQGLNLDPLGLLGIEVAQPLLHVSIAIARQRPSYGTPGGAMRVLVADALGLDAIRRPDVFRCPYCPTVNRRNDIEAGCGVCGSSVRDCDEGDLRHTAPAPRVTGGSLTGPGRPRPVPATRAPARPARSCGAARPGRGPAGRPRARRVPRRGGPAPPAPDLDRPERRPSG